MPIRKSRFWNVDWIGRLIVGQLAVNSNLEHFSRVCGIHCYRIHGRNYTFLARYRAYVIVPIFFRVSTITFERINRLTSNFEHLEIGQK